MRVSAANGTGESPGTPSPPKRAKSVAAGMMSPPDPGVSSESAGVRYKAIAAICAGLLAGMLCALALVGCSAAQDDQDGQMTTEDAASEEESVIIEAAQQTSYASADDAAQAELAAPKPLVVTDYGWKKDDAGTIDFGVAIYNPNEYVEALSPVLTVKGLGMNGAVVLSESTQISIIAPGGEYKMSFLANAEGEVSTDMIADVAFTVTVSDDGWGIKDPENDDMLTELTYVYANEAVVQSDVDGVNALTGLVAIDTGNGTQGAAQKEALAGSDQTQRTYVNAILYDSSGNMLAGYFDVVDLSVDGTPSAYEIYMPFAPDYATYEIYSHPYDYSL